MKTLRTSSPKKPAARPSRRSRPSALRCAVIGVGVGWNHIEGYLHAAGSEVAALCDANEALLNERGDAYGVPKAMRFTDYHALLARKDIDAVSIALPNFLHEPVAVEALAAGKHVLCEKPLAMDAASGQRIVDAARAAGRTLMVCYNHRYRAEIAWLKQRQTAGDFGRIYAAKAGWMREGWIPSHGAWFTRKDRAGGGALIDLGVHVLDLALWLMGYPNPVRVSGAAFAEFGPRGQKHLPRDIRPPRFDVEDMGMGFVRFEGGAVLAFESAWATHREPARDGYFVRLFGSEAGANFYTAEPGGKTVAFYTLRDGLPVEETPDALPKVSGHRVAVAEFVDCVLTGRAPASPGEHGVIGLRIIDAIYESTQSGREVALAQE